MAPSGQTQRGVKVPALIEPLACFRLNCAQTTGRKGEELMAPGRSQRPSPPNLAQLVQAAGTGSLAPRLFQHSLLTLLIPSCSPASPAVPLPGGGPEPANCTSKAAACLHHWGCRSLLLFWGLLTVWDRMVTGSIPCPFLFPISC